VLPGRGHIARSQPHITLTGRRRLSGVAQAKKEERRWRHDAPPVTTVVAAWAGWVLLRAGAARRNKRIGGTSSLREHGRSIAIVTTAGEASAASALARCLPLVRSSATLLQHSSRCGPAGSESSHARGERAGVSPPRRREGDRWPLILHGAWGRSATMADGHVHQPAAACGVPGQGGRLPQRDAGEHPPDPLCRTEGFRRWRALCPLRLDLNYAGSQLRMGIHRPVALSDGFARGAWGSGWCVVGAGDPVAVG